jgi:dipeptidase D
MNNSIQGLEPQLLWHHFYEISQIPRCSGYEKQVRDYVLEIAKRKGLDYRMDTAGNLVVKGRASTGCENNPIVVLQGHLDMVCEKDKDSRHDFSKEAIRLKREDDWIGADGTTLGADNGIGVAASLAVLESENIKHGPLEFLFTVDEESGLTGAMDLANDMLDGRLLVNMDTEEDGALYIGCAGGKDTELFLESETQGVPSGFAAARLRVGGLRGGHSGIDIHEGRGNAIKLLVRFLWRQARQRGISVVSIDGGSKHNAIPRDCEAIVFLPQEKLVDLKHAATEYGRVLRSEYEVTDPAVTLSLDESGFRKPSRIFSPAFQHRILNSLNALPNGVISMSQAVPGLVQTSTNLGIVHTGDSQIRFVTSQRSSVPSELERICDMVCAVGEQAGSEIQQGNGYPAWKPNPNSPLLNTAKFVYESLFGNTPEVKAVHAGLECGVIGDKFPGMDMISFGPTILGAHSPSERVQISTVKKFWDFLVFLLERLAS